MTSIKQHKNVGVISQNYLLFETKQLVQTSGDKL